MGFAHTCGMTFQRVRLLFWFFLKRFSSMQSCLLNEDVWERWQFLPLLLVRAFLPRSAETTPGKYRPAPQPAYVGGCGSRGGDTSSLSDRMAAIMRLPLVPTAHTDGASADQPLTIDDDDDNDDVVIVEVGHVPAGVGGCVEEGKKDRVDHGVEFCFFLRASASREARSNPSCPSHIHALPPISVVITLICAAMQLPPRALPTSAKVPVRDAKSRGPTRPPRVASPELLGNDANETANDGETVAPRVPTALVAVESISLDDDDDLPPATRNAHAETASSPPPSAAPLRLPPPSPLPPTPPPPLQDADHTAPPRVDRTAGTERKRYAGVASRRDRLVKPKRRRNIDDVDKSSADKAGGREWDRPPSGEGVMDDDDTSDESTGPSRRQSVSRVGTLGCGVL